MTYRCANVVSMLFSIQFRLETGVRGMYKVEGFYFIHLWKGSYACYYNTTGVVYLQPCNITLSSIHTSRSIVMDVITHYNTSTLHISGGIQFVIKYSNICDERTSLRLAGRQLCSSLPSSRHRNRPMDLPRLVPRPLPVFPLLHLWPSVHLYWAVWSFWLRWPRRVRAGALVMEGLKYINKTWTIPS